MMILGGARRLGQAAARRAPAETWVFVCCVMVPLMLEFAAVLFIVYQTLLLKPHYSVAIHSVSGHYPVSGGAALDPEFNLTVRVASRGFWVGQCAERGMAVDVSYGGVALASGMTTTTETICARPRKAVDQSVVARGDGVIVPASVLHTLTVNMVNEVQVFDVSLRGSGEKKASWMCGPRRVGDASALQTECLKS